MARKGENIFKRKDGRWEARYIKGHELSGKIKYGFCYGKTYREAKEKVTKCRAAVLNSTPLPGTRVFDTPNLWKALSGLFFYVKFIFMYCVLSYFVL